jgi:major membrane immunogen (membrane-anchored lipoprotein)
MLRNKMVSLILTLTMAAGILVGCSSKSASSSDTGKLTDGTYKVEYETFDSHDYKPQLELTVSGGKITAVKYDEFSKDGTFKSKDATYRKNMEEQAKTYPEKAFNELQQQIIAKQAANIDGVSGATASSTTFKALAKYAVDEMAKKGVTTPGKIKAAK